MHVCIVVYIVVGAKKKHSIMDYSHTNVELDLY